MPWRFSPDSRISAKALERQMRNWELSRLQRLGREDTSRPPVEDFVTVSRQVGGAGEEIASGLGERLGWPVFGKNLLEAMAGDDSIRRVTSSSWAWSEAKGRSVPGSSAPMPRWRSNHSYILLRATLL